MSRHRGRNLRIHGMVLLARILLYHNVPPFPGRLHVDCIVNIRMVKCIGLNWSEFVSATGTITKTRTHHNFISFARSLATFSVCSEYLLQPQEQELPLRAGAQRKNVRSIMSQKHACTATKNRRRLCCRLHSGKGLGLAFLYGRERAPTLFRLFKLPDVVGWFSPEVCRSYTYV